MNEDIKVSFIIRKDCKNENECSEEMQLAFVTCEQHRGGGLQPRWVKETELTKLDGLTKRDVFVLNEFAGEIFERLKATKCLLIGPRCLSCCLTEGTPIPSGPEPVFTVAMRGLVVTASGLTKHQKESIKRKVQWMGGIYNSALTDETTHLVADTVLSDKYIKSVAKGIPVMSESWVETVWETSLSLNVNGGSSDFAGHRLPPFTNLQVTTSGISKKEKQLIMKLVQDHGGTFSGAFQSETTDVVVLTKEGVSSEKYKAALEYNKAVVLPSWVKDSAKLGVALPLGRYRVASTSASSPVGEHREPNFSMNFSSIRDPPPPSAFVDESRSVDHSTISGRMKLSLETRKSSDGVDKDVQTAFENFDMSTIKKAGPIFDGFCIWVAGPEGAWRERACSCVSRGGGVRYSAAHERVTHVLAGSAAAAAAAAAALPAAPVLSPLWLLRSVAAGRALSEAEFLIDIKPGSPKPSSARKARPEPASPMSRRNLQLLRLAPPSPQRLSEPEPPRDDIVDQYLSQNLPPEPEMDRKPEPGLADTTLRPSDVTDDVDEPTEEVEQIFRGIKIEVQGLDEEAICEIGAEVSAAGGCLVAAGAGGSHVLLPLDFDPDERVTKEAIPVTVFWVKDCLSQQELVPVQYQHQPVRIQAGAGPLAGVVASLSTYSGVERAFLDELAKQLGATTQLRFCRRTTANALASTHLLCPTPQGDKYWGAVKWGLPAVRGQWLLHCASTGRREPEGPYLVGDTKAPDPPADITADEAHITADESVEPPVHTKPEDKENAMRPPAAAPPPAPRRGSAGSAPHTPAGKPRADAEADLSPASRYIAMARQGLLGGDTQETPKHAHDNKNDAERDVSVSEVRTPNLEDALSTPNLRGLSPSTKRRLQALRRGDPPSGPIRTPADPFEKNRIETPDSAFGAAMRPGSGRLSPDARKRLWQFVAGLPTKDPPLAKEKQQTPLSEIKNRFLAQFNGDAPTPPSEHVAAPRKLCLQEHAESPAPKVAKTSANQSPGGAAMPSPSHPSHAAQAETSTKSAASNESSLPPAVDAQLLRLSAALSRNSPVQRQRRQSVKPTIPAGPESEPGPESQPSTVGWDDGARRPASPPPVATPAAKRFMLSSNVDNREELIAMIQYLGGEVSDGTELDPDATHLLCAAPGRSEKMLGSVAHGKWVLHPAYVTRSRASGAFVDEEDYEWGNPRATCLPALSANEQTLANAAHRWRKARADNQPGPFDGVVALLHIAEARRRLLAKLLIAGGGQAITDDPPYEDPSVTVCFADVKRRPLTARDAAWLRARRVPVCAPVVLSCYLTDERRPDLWAHCLPDFRP